MGRHSLPDAKASSTGRARSPRRRTVSIATALVLAVAAGTGIAAQRGLLSFADPCADTPVRLDLVASPDIAPALRTIADRARRDRVTTDGRYTWAPSAKGTGNPTGQLCTGSPRCISSQ